eukprot:Selendium_serpulae@DN3986_c0_g1_i1.p1
MADDERMSVSEAGSVSMLIAPPNVRQLLKLMEREVAEKQPSNVINFLVDFLCKHYPEHLGGFAAIWNGDPNLERDRLQVVEFFRFQKLPAEMATHFINAGFDTLETLCTLTSESLDDIERFNNTRWLPGHKVRLQQSFSDIAGRVRAYRQEREKLMQMARVTTGHCDHPAIVTRTNLPGNRVPMITSGPNPMPRIRPLPPPVSHATVTPAPYTGATLSSGATFNTGMATRL